MKGLDAARVHDSPLAATLGLLDRERYFFDLQPPSPGGASERTLAALLADGRSVARQVEAAGRGSRARDAALAVVGGYAWRVCGPGIACYVLSRRVPDLRPENLALRFDENGAVAEAALLGGRFAVLPSDPAADHPEAVVLDDEDALLGWLRERVVACMEPLVGTVREHVRVGRRTLWRGVADYVAAAFLTVGWDTADQALCAARAGALLGTPGSPLAGAATGFFVVEHRGRRGAYATRGLCCQAYRDPRYGNCDSCPMLLQEERERRARADLAARA